MPTGAVVSQTYRIPFIPSKTTITLPAWSFQRWVSDVGAVGQDEWLPFPDEPWRLRETNLKRSADSQRLPGRGQMEDGTAGVDDDSRRMLEVRGLRGRAPDGREIEPANLLQIPVVDFHDHCGAGAEQGRQGDNRSQAAAIALLPCVTSARTRMRITDGANDRGGGKIDRSRGRSVPSEPARDNAVRSNRQPNRGAPRGRRQFIPRSGPFKGTLSDRRRHQAFRARGLMRLRLPLARIRSPVRRSGAVRLGRYRRARSGGLTSVALDCSRPRWTCLR